MIATHTDRPEYSFATFRYQGALEHEFESKPEVNKVGK